MVSSAWAEVFYVALPEELVLRGAVQGELRRRRWSNLAQVVLPAVLFALLHLPRHGLPGLATVAPGLLFGWLRLRTGSIWPAVALHAAGNVWWLSNWWVGNWWVDNWWVSN